MHHPKQTSAEQKVSFALASLSRPNIRWAMERRRAGMAGPSCRDPPTDQ
jgi:hypothetical protein